MLRKITDHVVSVWHDFLNWWNAIPQELMATKLMHHYEVTRFLMSVTSFIAFIWVPYLFIRQCWNQFSVNVQGNLWATIILVNFLVILSISNMLITRKKYTGSLLEALIFFNKLLFLGGMIYAASSLARGTSSRVPNVAVGPDIMLCLCLWFLLYCYSKVIQWLIRLSVNKDIVWIKEFIGATKKFKQDSVWHQYEQHYRPSPSDTNKAEVQFHSSVSVSSLEYYQKMWRERLANEQQTVNSNMLVAFNAGLPYQLVQQAKELDQVGAYSLPTVKLETPWPLKYRFEIRVDYFEYAEIKPTKLPND